MGVELRAVMNSSSTLMACGFYVQEDLLKYVEEQVLKSKAVQAPTASAENNQRALFDSVRNETE